MKGEGKMHKKYVIKLIKKAEKLFEKMNTLVDLEIKSNERINVCGDIHGQ